jgi:hypothetical protein
MPYRPRPRRIAVLGARMQLADTVVDLLNVSRAGALIRASYELRPDTEWPIVVKLPAAPVRLTGRVVRCESAEVLLPGGAALQRQYAVAVTFVNPSAEAQAILDQECGPAVETGEPLKAPREPRTRAPRPDAVRHATRCAHRRQRSRLAGRRTKR